MKSSVIFLSEKPFTCRQGGKDVSDGHDLLRQSAIDSGRKPHRSTECREAFPRSSNPAQLLKCSDSGTDFQEKSALLSHLKMHSKEILFGCQTVGNSLEEKSTLDNYQKFHTGEASHVCKECGKTFSHPFTLRKHKKFHSGVKDYECSNCGKTFSHKLILIHHQSSHGRKALRVQ